MNPPLPPLSDDFFDPRPGVRLLLSGAAAAARGAWEAGVGFALTYPGSPVVETYEALAAPDGPAAARCRVAVNEHVAWHEAFGYALAGGRSLVVMKHVGFHVANDPAHYSAVLGVRGGMVAVVGDDPGATCSTGEFDVRFHALHAHLPVVEPSDVEEARALARAAFELSESEALPVLLVMPSGLCHGVGTAAAGPVDAPRAGLAFRASPDYTSVGGRAVRLRERLFRKIDLLARGERPLPFPVATFLPGDGPDLIVAPSVQLPTVAEWLVRRGLSGRVPVWSPKLTYPLPVAEFARVLAATGARRILCVEPLEGFLEHQIGVWLARRGGPAPELHGKDLVPAAGELSSVRVGAALARFLGLPEEPPSPESGAAPREGTFCPGCSHRAFFHMLRGALRPGDVIGGDIGCSSLPPHHSDWLTCMNSGASIAAGVARAVASATADAAQGSGRAQRVVSLIGDSTLLHGGLQTVLECAQTGSDQLLFVLDNGWTAMTGHQPTPATPDGRDGRTPGAPAVDLRGLLAALGVRDLHELDPFRLRGGRAMIRRLLERAPGFACVIVRRECRLQSTRRARSEPPPPWRERFMIVPERCRACGECYAVLTCPAIDADADGIARIDPLSCSGCGICRDACPNGAIVRLRERSRFAPADPAEPPPPSAAGQAAAGDGPPHPAMAAAPDPFSLILTGLGGQGVLTAGRLLRHALAARKLAGWDNRGGAQRFGHVAAIIRATAEPGAPLSLDIPPGAADALLALEASEALRFLDRAGPRTLVLLDRFVLVPTNVRRARGSHPSADEVAARFRARGAAVALDDFRARAAALSGDARDASLLMIGRLAALTGMPDEAGIERAATARERRVIAAGRAAAGGGWASPV